MTEAWHWHQKTAEALAALEANPPPIFYHYTNARGLVGILRDQVIWAGAAECMNDEMELKYAREVAARVAEEMLPEAKTEEGRRLLASITAKSNLLMTMQDYYIASFTTNGDQLSQWRAYADNGLGFAVGFGTLDGFACAPSSPVDCLSYMYRGRARRLVYDRVQQDALLAPVVREALENAESGLHHSEPDSVDMATIETLLSLKNPGFSEEDEWRLVVATGPEGPPRLQIEPSRFGLTHYLRLAYYGKEALEGRASETPVPKLLPIVHIVAGPRVANTYAVYHLAQQAGYWARCEELYEALAGERVYISKSAASYR